MTEILQCGDVAASSISDSSRGLKKTTIYFSRKKMMSYTNKIFTLFAVATMITGCGSKIDCNGNKVKENAIEIIQSHLNNAVWYNEIHAALSGEPELTSVKTLSRNDELKQGTCSAKYSFTYNGKPREIDVAYDLAYLQDKGETEVRVAVNDVIGGMMALVMTEHPIKNGIEKIIDPKTGNLQHQLEWKNGVQDGTEEIYNPETNKLIAKIHVIDGRKVGSEKRWNTDGSVLLIDLDWKDGKATGFQKQFDPSGSKLITDLVFKDGKASGLQTIGNNLKYDEYYFKDGVYNGIHKSYLANTHTANGMYLYRVDNYKDGKLDGLSQEFNEDGKVVSENIYKDGVLASSSAQSNSSSINASNPQSSACLDGKISAFHKEKGEDAVVSADMLEEWSGQCSRQ